MGARAAPTTTSGWPALVAGTLRSNSHGLASLLGAFGSAKTQDRAVCGPDCRFCRISARRAWFVASHRPESELARREVLALAWRAESFARRCFARRCGCLSGCQRKTSLGPRVGGHQGQNAACLL